MKTIYRDSIAALLAVVGGVVIFAKLESYSWWLIGSWKGALGVLAVLGLGILFTNAWEIFRMRDGTAVGELSLWILAATVTIASLFDTTSKAEFLWSAGFVGVAWLVQTIRHAWGSTHTHGHHYLPAN